MVAWLAYGIFLLTGLAPSSGVLAVLNAVVVTLAVNGLFEGGKKTINAIKVK